MVSSSRLIKLEKLEGSNLLSANASLQITFNFRVNFEGITEKFVFSMFEFIAVRWHVNEMPPE
jgi:hypothetical protein